MAFERAVNSETGEVVFLVDNQWVKPTDTAVNDKGEKAYLVSNQWEVPSIAQPKEESPMLGSLEKGVVGAKQAVKQAQLASLIDLQEADKVTYGANYESAPQEELAKIQARDKSIQEKLQTVAQYGVERKEIEAKRGVNPLMQEVRNIGSSEAYKNADTLDQLKMYGNAIWNKKSNIPGYIASIGLESLPSSLPSIASAMAVKLGGMGTKAAAIAGGTGSAFTEFGNQYAELRAEGLNHKEAWEKAGVKSGIIGMFDAASFYSAGSSASNIMRNIEKGAIKATVKETGKEISTQALYGMAGEAGGSLAIGQKLDPIQIIEEGLGEIAGAPIEATTTYQKNKTKVAEPKFVEDEKGNLVPSPELVKERQIETLRKKAAETTDQGEVTAILDQIKDLEKPVVAAPITTGAQQDLFTKEEAPFQVSPDVRTTETATGKPLEVEAPQAPERQQAELQRQLDVLQQQEQTPEIQAQIATLQQQMPETPEQRIATLRDQYDVLERERVALQETHAAAPDLKTKGDIIVQSRAIFEQQQALENEIKGLRKEVGVTETARPGTEEAAIPEQGALEFQVSPIVDDKVLDGFGFTKKATKIKDQLRDLDMNKPEDREKLLDQVAKHERKGAKVDMQAVEDYVNNFTQPQEAPNVPRPVVSGAIPGGSQPSVPVPSGAVTPTQATAAPIAGRMAGNIPIAGGVDAGEAGVPAQGTATVAPTTQAVPAVVPTTQATPALADEGEQILNSLRSAGGVTKPKATFKFPWFKKETDRVDTDFKNNSLFGELKSGFINIFSFDDAYNNLLRRGLFKLSDQEKITEEEAILALRRSDVTQVVHRGQLATEAINTGELVYDPKTNRYHVEANPDNMGALKKQIIALSKRVGISVDDALASISKAFEAGRINEIYGTLNKTSAELTRTEKKIASLRAIKKRTKAEEKELNTKEKLLINLKKDKQSYIDQVQHMTRAEAQKGMELFKVPEIAEGARIWQVMRKRTIKELVRSGVTSEDNAERWLSHMAYVPFFRDLGEERGVGMQIMRKGLGESMTEYGFDGSMLPVSNTIGNLYQWMHWSYARAISNQHMRVAKDQLQAVFPDIIKTGTGAVGKTFTVYEDGQRKEYTVANAAVAKMFLETGSVLFPSITLANKYKDLFTKFITRWPGFSTAQLLLKDTWEALHTSGVKNPYGIIKNVFVEIGKTALGTSEARKELMSRGQLSTREHAMASQYESEMSQRLELKDPNYYRKVINMLDKFSALNDNMLRQAVYQQLINEGASKDEAADRATEIFNYRRSSGSSMMQTLNNVVPFLNAFGVSSRVAYRTVSGKGITAQTRLEGAKTLFMASALMTAGQFMLLIATGDDDEYKKMNRLHRDKSLLIPGAGFTLPLREGWFMMDKLVAEYTYNLLVNSATTDAQMFKDALARAFKKQFEPPIGGVVVAPIGLAMNRDVFNNKDIVNKTQERLESPYQMNKNTSELAKLLGDAGDISPLKLDYFFNSFFGTTMPAVAWLTNEAIAEARGVPRPSQSSWDKFASIPTVGGFMPKENTSGNAADFYAAARETDKVLATIKHIAVTDTSKARAKIEEARPTLVKTEGIKNAIEGLNRQESIIRNMPAMIKNEQGELVPNMFQNNVPVTSESKQAEIKKIEERRKELTSGIMAIRKRVFQ